MRRALHLATATIAALAIGTASTAAMADAPSPAAPATFAPDTASTPMAQRPGDIVIDTPGERSTQNVALLGVTAGLGAVAAGIAVYYNLQSRSDANDLTSPGATGMTWTVARAATQAEIHTDNTRAAIGYSVGGALIIGAAIALILTEPSGSTTVIHPRTADAGVVLAPTSGGALFGGRWSF